MRSETEIQHGEELEIPESILMTLMQPYLQKGHNLFMDSWYSNPVVFEQLHANSTGAFGTARPTKGWQRLSKHKHFTCGKMV
jgi:hypothetical protein